MSRIRTRHRVARVTEGGGNVFADLGLPNPEQELLNSIRFVLRIKGGFVSSGRTDHRGHL